MRRWRCGGLWLALAFWSGWGTGSARAEHPLAPVVAWAEQVLPSIAAIRDYSGQVSIHEAGQPETAMNFRVRHRPLAVYFQVWSPAESRGAELLWRSENGSRVWAHEPGRRTFFIPMDHQRLASRSSCSVRDFGLVPMTQRLIALGRREMQWPDYRVRTTPATLNGATCRMIEIEHTQYDPVRHAFSRAVVCVDDTLHVPVHVGIYRGRSPVFAVTFGHLRLNQGFTERDFDPASLRR